MMLVVILVGLLFSITLPRAWKLWRQWQEERLITHLHHRIELVEQLGHLLDLDVVMHFDQQEDGLHFSIERPAALAMRHFLWLQKPLHLPSIYQFSVDEKVQDHYQWHMWPNDVEYPGITLRGSACYHLSQKNQKDHV